MNLRALVEREIGIWKQQSEFDLENAKLFERIESPLAARTHYAHMCVSLAKLMYWQDVLENLERAAVGSPWMMPGHAFINQEYI